MWRAWGIFLSFWAQDPAQSFISDTHEMVIHPPADWTRLVGKGPMIARFVPGDFIPPEGAPKVPPWGITLTHLYYGAKPKPLVSFVKEARAYLEREFKGLTIREEKELKIGGLPAFRIVFDFEKTLQIKTIVPRSNIEYYLLDISLLKSDEAKYRALAEASLETFRIVPRTLTEEEAGAHSRTAELFRAAKIQPALLGERWHSVYLREKKVGFMRTKLAEADGKYAFESEIRYELGEDNVDSTMTRGSFSPDGRIQKVETENTKTSGKKDHWHWKASVSIEGGRLKAARDLDGVKEEKSFPVEDGVLFSDVADIVRRSLAQAGQGPWLLRTLSPYSDEPWMETVEVTPKSTLELDGVRREAVILFSYKRHLWNVTYYLSPEGRLFREGGVRDDFSIRASTKDEAMGPSGKK